MFSQKENKQAKPLNDAPKINLYDKVGGVVNKNNYIEPGESKQGMFLISGDFHSCIGVVAILENCEYAVYHARSTVTTSNPYLKFINQVADKVDEVYIFEKDRHAKGLDKFARSLSADLKCPNVNLIPIDNYQVIIADAKHRTIKIVKEQQAKGFITDSDQKTHLNYSGKCREIIIVENEFKLGGTSLDKRP